MSPARPLALAAALAMTGCGLATAPPADTTLAPDQSAALGDGRFLVAWTVAGQTPTGTACAGVDHLTLRLSYRSGGRVSIEPIPCALTRFRYDGMPAGSATLDLTGLDGTGCRVTGASAGLTVSPTLPADPSPVLDLGSPQACR